VFYYLYATATGIVNCSTPVGNTTMRRASVGTSARGAVQVTPTPKKICSKSKFQKFLMEIEGEGDKDEEEDTVLENY
jgi:hypothetical protein